MDRNTSGYEHHRPSVNACDAWLCLLTFLRVSDAPPAHLIRAKASRKNRLLGSDQSTPFHPTNLYSHPIQCGLLCDTILPCCSLAGAPRILQGMENWEALRGAACPDLIGVLNLSGRSRPLFALLLLRNTQRTIQSEILTLSRFFSHV
jgi:hypothetical protein